MIPKQSDTLQDFFLSSSLLKYQKAEMVIRSEEDFPACLYYLRSGYVRMNTLLPDGKELTVNIFQPGSVFPIIGALTDTPNTYSFQSITTSTINRADKQTVLHFLSLHPEIRDGITKRIMRGTSGLLKRMEQMFFQSSHVRVSSSIIMLARRFGTAKPDGGVDITIPMTHQEIANLSAIARETASAAMEELKKRNLISYRYRYISIPNLDALTAETEPDASNGFMSHMPIEL